MKLYIIGNGFDLQHALKTKWSDFKSYLMKNNNELFELIKDIYDPIEFWTDLEHALGKPNITFLNKIDKLFKMSNIISYSFKTDIINNLIRWIRTIDTTNCLKIYSFDNDDLFFSFNYTPTIELLYDVDYKNVMHIHGYVPDTYYYEDAELILGHNNPSDEKEIITATRKDTNKIIDKNKNWFKNLSFKDIKYIKVIGVSYNDIDFCYFKAIKKELPNVHWDFCYHTDSDKIKALNYASMLGLKKDAYTLLKV